MFHDSQQSLKLKVAFETVVFVHRFGISFPQARTLPEFEVDATSTGDSNLESVPSEQTNHQGYQPLMLGTIYTQGKKSADCLISQDWNILKASRLENIEHLKIRVIVFLVRFFSEKKSYQNPCFAAFPSSNELIHAYWYSKNLRYILVYKQHHIDVYPTYIRC